MTILFLGNTPLDFGLPPSVTDTATSGARDAAYSPQACLLTVGAVGVINHAAPATDLWIHDRFFCNNVSTSNNLNAIIVVYDGSGNRIAEWGRQAADTAANLRVRVFGSTTVTGALYAITPSVSLTQTIDFKLTVGGSGANIVAECYINGTLVSSATATNSGTVKGAPVMTHVVGYQNNSYHTEVIVADEDTRGMRLATLSPGSNGSDTGMTGGFANLADLDPNTGAISDTVGQRSSWNPTSYGGAGSPTGIRGVYLKARAIKNGSAITKLCQYMKISGTNYDGSDLTINNGSLMQEFANNPATAAPWAVAALTSQFGLKSVA